MHAFLNRSESVILPEMLTYLNYRTLTRLLS